MQIYLFTGGLQSDELIALEARLTASFRACIFSSSLTN